MDEILLPSGHFHASNFGLSVSSTKNGQFSSLLASSILTNVTSCSRSRNDVSATAHQSLKIVGCHVHDCSNHLYGTACRDMNAGGSLLSHNTSFLRCTTEAPTHQNEYFSIRTELSPTESSHFFRLCTFKDCTTIDLYGGALHLQSPTSDLIIEDSSFESCMTDRLGMAGAVYHDPVGGIGLKTTLKASSFVKCSAPQNSPGSLYVRDPRAVTISDCVFLDSTCRDNGGALQLHQSNPPQKGAVLSNCLFQRCRVTSQFPERRLGGACYFYNHSSIRLDSLCFLENNATAGGIDIYFENFNDAFNKDTVTNCVSTSTPAEKRFLPSSHSDLLRDLPEPPTPSVDIEQNENQAVVTVNMDAVVSGKILVLVSNENGSRTEENGKAPRIGRLVLIDFVQNSSGSTIVSCGEDGLLQLPLTDYEVVTSSFFPKPALLAVNQPTLIENQTKAKVTLVGLMLKGEYTLTLSVNSSETDTMTVIVTFASNAGTLEEIVYDPETPTNAKLSFNTIYSVVKMEKDGESVLFKKGLFFTIDPEPERLTEISVGDINHTPSSTTTLLTFSSRALKREKEYTLTLVSTAAQNNPSHERTIKVMPDENGELKAFTATLYPFETEDEKKKSQLDFGVEYTVTSFLLGTAPILFDEEKTTFTTPHEPPRIEECEEPELSGDRSSVHVVFSGRALKDGLGHVNVTDGESFWESTSTLVCSSTNQCTATFLTGIVEDTTKLGFGQKYSIVSSRSMPPLFVVNENVKLSVPKAPIVTETETELNASTHLSFRIVMDGSDLPSTGVFTASLEGVSETVEITFDGNEGKSDWIEMRKNTAMQFNKTYTLSTLIHSESGKEDEHVLCSGVEIETPEGPTLLRVGEVKLEGQEMETVVMEIELKRMPVGSFQVEVIDSLDQSQTKIELTIAISDVSDTTAVIRESVGEAKTLKYGHSYDIVGMSSADIDVSIPSSLSFFVPNLPHFESISVSPNTLGTAILVSFSGSNFVGSYAVKLNSGFSFVIAASSPTQAASSEVLLGWSDGLPFNTQFPVSTITYTSSPSPSFSVKPGLSLDTPPKPTELTLFVNSLSTDSTRFCGGKSRPCSSFDPAWVIVKGIDVKRATLSIIDSASLSTPITISDKMIVLFSNGGNHEPTLTIPSSVSMGDEKGMVVVRDATLDIVDVGVDIESTLSSFIFLSAIDSTIVLKDGSFSGHPSVNSPLTNDDEEEENDVCGWSSGILQLDNSSTKITFTVLSNLSQGAVNMKGGTLKIDTSTFHDNIPTISSFLSARRNIHCSENGLIEIGSLNGGDGTGDTKSGFISSEDCTITSTVISPNAPLFIPTLSSESSSSLDKKTGTFSIVICGSTLILCLSK
ncbi:hypothetical protein BLNAU_21005 [Blattamonas nauphoetae]|uniref:Uncharacterized protein n=1 Tax=Blattamonas nauphoetae TaxID=2049346 RepID=A0ABQ9WXP6_9EUKA|nr:hypothetical protein BLNAU_21005 [Blattamonas nauphoetae]